MNIGGVIFKQRFLGSRDAWFDIEDSLVPLISTLDWEEISSQAQLFLWPGHGRFYGDCKDNDHCADGYPTDTLPEDRKAYIDTVRTAVHVAQQEVETLKLGKEAVIAVMGHV